VIRDSIITAYFPKGVFYEDFYFDYSYEDGMVKLHNSSVPAHKNFRLTFDVSGYSQEELKTLYIAQKNRYGKLYYVSTKHKDDTFYTLSKNLGEFTLISDNYKPTIRAVGFKEGQWLTSFNTLQVKIYDKGSGIRSYRAELDGQWIRMAYNPKNGILTYDFSDRKLEETLHNLKVVVTDNVNNSTTFTIAFNKKN
jgi:hypothetical protein